MSWDLIIDNEAKKKLKRLPAKEVRRIHLTLEAMAFNPYSGDIEKMRGEDDIWRRRAGSYRIFYQIIKQRYLIYVYDIRRRTSTTYWILNQKIAGGEEKETIEKEEFAVLMAGQIDKRRFV